MDKYIKTFNQISSDDIAEVGGKNASLGEMIKNLKPLGVEIPDGFAITVDGYAEFLAANTLTPVLYSLLNQLDRHSLDNLSEIAEKCRSFILHAKFPEQVAESIKKAYTKLVAHGMIHSVAVRSSATAEDSPTASFAGQHESYLNVTGVENVIEAVQKCYASLFNDRAIKYRQDNGFKDLQVALSVGVQLMVRSDKASAGVVFTIEPENGNQNLIYITGAWGLGESVVQGAVNTDEFYLFKPAIEKNMNSIVSRKMGSKEQKLIYSETSKKNIEWTQTSPSERDQFILSDREVEKLGKWCLAIEKHYNMPVDIEWAKDATSEKLFIVQARPETVHSRNKTVSLKEFSLVTTDKPLLTGKAVGRSIVSGKVSIVKSLADSGKVNPGDIILADITNPDWNALLKKAVCIVTNKGGRTSHASIIA